MRMLSEGFLVEGEDGNLREVKAGGNEGTMYTDAQSEYLKQGPSSEAGRARENVGQPPGQLPEQSQKRPPKRPQPQDGLQWQPPKRPTLDALGHTPPAPRENSPEPQRLPFFQGLPSFREGFERFIPPDT